MWPWGFIGVTAAFMLLLVSVWIGNRMLDRYCSAWFIPKKYEPCCKKHDNAYGVRGTYVPGGPLISRRQADRDCLKCWIELGMWKIFAYVMWVWMRVWFWMYWRKEKTGGVALHD